MTYAIQKALSSPCTLNHAIGVLSFILFGEHFQKEPFSLFKTPFQCGRKVKTVEKEMLRILASKKLSFETGQSYFDFFKDLICFILAAYTSHPYSQLTLARFSLISLTTSAIISVNGSDFSSSSTNHSVTRILSYSQAFTLLVTKYILCHSPTEKMGFQIYPDYCSQMFQIYAVF